MTTVEAHLTASVMVDALERCGVTHLVWLPDTESGHLYQTLRDHPRLTLVPVAREGETFAIALGLRIGGKKPVVCIQSTGLFESGDSVRGLVLDLAMPLVMMVGYRGFHRDRPITDSAATYTEPILKAWGLPYQLVETDADVPNISRAFEAAREQGQAVCVLIGREYE